MPRPAKLQTPAIAQVPTQAPMQFPVWLAGGVAPFNAVRTPITCAALLQDAVDELGPHCASSEAVRFVVDGLKAWLTEGGDMNVHFGVRAGRGKASELPYRKARKDQRDSALRQLGCDLGRRALEDRARAIADLVKVNDPRVLAIHHQTGAPVPTSVPQIKRILRASPAADHEDGSI